MELVSALVVIAPHGSVDPVQFRASGEDTAGIGFVMGEVVVAYDLVRIDGLGDPSVMAGSLHSVLSIRVFGDAPLVTVEDISAICYYSK